MEPAETHRICLTLHYDGGAFHGWQLQKAQRTVQGELEGVLGRLFAAPARVLGSGRTDRGVHATGQVATVDAPARWSAAELHRALRALLPPDIWIADARVVPSRFHPRYDAVRRAYVYRIGTAHLTRSPFHNRWCWPFADPLDRGRMAAAVGALPGDHSFRRFAKAGQEERGDRCIVHEARWAEWRGLGLELHISANRFLHHMVRYLVGTLVEIGAGRREVDVLARMLTPEAELETSPPAPPQGLFLRAVEYPPAAWGDSGPPETAFDLDPPPLNAHTG